MTRNSVALAVMTIALAASPPAAEATTRISATSPALGCTDPLVQAASDNMEFEPHLVVNPRDPRHLVAAWSQDIFFGGRVSTVAYSRDGGRTWTRTVPQGINACTGRPDAHFAGDPWLTFSADGDVHLAQLTGFGRASAPGRIDVTSVRTRLVVSRSRDGGRTWGRPATFGRPDGFNDKEVIEAAPDDPNLIYAGWRFDPDARTAADPLALVLSRSTDHGRTWSKPKAFRKFTTPGVSGQNVQLVPFDDGRVLVTWFERLPNGTVTYFAARSTNQGRTFGRPVRIGAGGSERLRDPERPEKLMPTATVFQDMARSGRTVWAVWADASVRALRRGRVMAARSTDEGRTWSPPRGIVERPGPLVFPSIAMARDGRLGLGWYDFRNDVPGDAPWTATYWFAESRTGRTWSGDRRVSADFDVRSVPGRFDYPGYFLGDYFGLVALDRGFGSSFMAGKPQARIGPTDIFFSRLALHR